MAIRYHTVLGALLFLGGVAMIYRITLNHAACPTPEPVVVHEVVREFVNVSRAPVVQTAAAAKGAEGEASAAALARAQQLLAAQGKLIEKQSREIADLKEQYQRQASDRAGALPPAAQTKTDHIQIRPKSDQPTILVLTPMRQREQKLDRYFRNLEGLDYPKHLISVAILTGDNTDQTEPMLLKKLNTMTEYRRTMLVRYDMSYKLSQAARHALGEQERRRANLAVVRNILLTVALRDEDWVLWIDSDLDSFPANTLNRLLSAKRDLVAPHIVLPQEGRTYDLNSWAETKESLARQKNLPKDALLLEGYPGQDNRRKHMNDFGGQEIVDLDGVGGAMLLVRGAAHRAGLIFPTFVFEHQIETEGLGRMAKAMGLSVVGMPNVKVYHR